MKIFILFLILLVPNYATAESTINCHCFQDRSFNHRDTGAADPYFLATTQNSFLALIYGVDKRNIVKAKMAGENGAQLWVLFDVANRSGKDISQVKAIQAKNKVWAKTFAQLNLPIDQRYRQLSNDPEQLADHIVDLQLRKYMGASVSEVATWRKLGMNRKELILATMLTGNPADIYAAISSKGQTWGQLLFNQGLLDSDAIKHELKKQMSKS